MAKDPAFLFYSDNFMTGTMFFSDEQAGKYIRLLCAQHLTGHLEEKDMIKICKSYDNDIWKKFVKDDEGKFFNERLEFEIVRRKAFSASRSKNKIGKKKHMKIISKSYENHMGNGNGNEIIPKEVRGKKTFVAPSLQAVIAFFNENGYSEKGAQKAFEYYSDANWHDSKGFPVKNWKQKMRGNWFRDVLSYAYANRDGRLYRS